MGAALLACVWAWRSTTDGTSPQSGYYGCYRFCSLEQVDCCISFSGLLCQAQISDPIAFVDVSITAINALSQTGKRGSKGGILAHIGIESGIKPQCDTLAMSEDYSINRIASFVLVDPAIRQWCNETFPTSFHRLQGLRRSFCRRSRNERKKVSSLD